MIERKDHMMALVTIAGEPCDDIKTCPGIHLEEDWSVKVQGPLDTAGLNLGPGETGVRISPDLILEAARQLRERGYDG
jgi:hypothetical protein